MYRSYGIALADLNHNGRLDLVVGTDFGDDNPIFVNDGIGGFELRTFGKSDMSIRNITVADLNGDNNLDIVVPSRGSQSFVYLNDGSGRFPVARPLGGRTDSSVSSVVGDVNCDGIPDIIIGRRDGQQSVTYINDGKAQFGQSYPFGPSNADTRAIAIGDLQNTGMPCLVACHLGVGTYIYLNDGTGRFSRPQPLGRSPREVFCITLVDIDLDGNLDIITAGRPGSNYIYFNHGNCLRFTEVPFDEGVLGTIYGIDVGDVDMDRYPEIAVARTGGPSGIFFCS